MLLLLSLIVIYAPLAFGSVEPWSKGILQILIFSLAILFASKKRWFNGSSPAYKTLLPALAGILLLATLQSLNFHPVKFAGGPLFTADRYSTLKALIWWPALAALLLTAVQIFRKPGALRNFSWTVFILGLVIALIGIAQKADDNTLLYGLRKLPFIANPFGPFINRDHAAAFLNMTMLAGWGIFFSQFAEYARHRFSGRGRKSEIMARQAMIFFMISAIFYGVIKTGSRAGLHSGVFAMGLMGMISLAFIQGKTARRTARLAFLLAIIGYAVILLNFPKWLGLQDNGIFDGSVTIRLYMYADGWRLFKDFPFFGTGLGSFIEAYPLYQSVKIKGIVEHMHSDWIKLLLETGVTGFLIYTAGLGLLLYRSFKTWLKCPSSEIKSLAGGVFAGITAFMAHSFTDFGFQIPANAVMFFLFLAYVSSAPVKDGKKYELNPEDEPVKKIPKSAVYFLSVCSIALLLLSVPPIIASYYDFKGKYSAPQNKAGFYERALFWDKNPKYAIRRGMALYNLARTDLKERDRLLKELNEKTAPYFKNYPFNLDLRRLKAHSTALMKMEDGKRETVHSFH